jgi:hypothetical protein
MQNIKIKENKLIKKINNMLTQKDIRNSIQALAT